MISSNALNSSALCLAASIGAAVKNDESTASVYSYSGMDWIGYDNPISVGTKVHYASANKLAGYFFWAIGMDSKYALPAAGGVSFLHCVTFSEHNYCP